MKKFLDRLKEPSTAAGAGLLASGMVAITNNDHAAAVGQAVEQAAPLIGAGDWSGLLTIALGFGAMFLRERGGR